MAEVTERLDRLEADIASVDSALRSLEELHTESGGRGGVPAAERIRAVVAPDRFPGTDVPAPEDSSGPTAPVEAPGSD